MTINIGLGCHGKLSHFLPTKYNLDIGRLNSKMTKLKGAGLITQYNEIINDHFEREFIGKVQNPPVTNKNTLFNTSDCN